VNVEGRTVLVTGASSGIGAALAERLAARGAVVGLVARREGRLAEVLDRCRRSSPGSRMWVADLGDLARAERVALDAWDELGGLDVVVHNAAIPKRRRVTALTPDEVDAVMRVNFLSPVHMTLALLPRMVERDAGLIVNVSSLGGRLGIAAEAAYSASKFALCGWSESLAMDLWGTGIGVRLIIPGAIDTEIWDQPDNDPPLYLGPREPPELVADGIIAAIEGDRFEHYLPDLKPVVEFKTGDPDAFFASAVAALAEGSS
jgi:NAD(P)-dependent dehydrogenase (short-subunit alcohol dehydrogenase family)